MENICLQTSNVIKDMENILLPLTNPRINNCTQKSTYNFEIRPKNALSDWKELLELFVTNKKESKTQIILPDYRFTWVRFG